MIRNFTPHSITLLNPDSVEGFVQVNPCTFKADSIKDGMNESFRTIPSDGEIRIAMGTTKVDSSEYPLAYGYEDAFELVKTTYGELTGLPEDNGMIDSDTLIVVSSLTKTAAHVSNHPLAKQMVSPYKVVRNAANMSQVFGCLGLSF